MAPYQKTNASIARSLRARLRWRYGAAAFVQEACRAEAAEQRRLVGLGRLELPTSRLSSARSNQLSYKPLTTINDHFLKKGSGSCSRATGLRQMISTSASPWRVFVREERETKTAKSSQWSSTILKLLAPDVSEEVR